MQIFIIQKYTRGLVLGLSIFLLAGVNSYAYDNHDFQFWNINIEEVRLHKSGKLVLEQEFRYGDNGSTFYYQHYDTGYVHEFNNFFNAGLGYRHVNQKKADKFLDESEPYAIIVIQGECAGFKISDRNRVEYRYFDYQVSSWRYRNKLDIKFPWKFTRKEIQPFIADEIFLRFNGTDLNQNRLFAGFAFNIIKNLKSEIYYMWQSTKNYAKVESYWTDINALGIKLKASF